MERGHVWGIGRLHMPKRAIWDVAVGLAGCIYIVMVFILNVQSSIFAFLFVLAAGYEVIGFRAARHSTPRRKPGS
jgi:hypothetical protein